jgi:hypothetical protein
MVVVTVFDPVQGCTAGLCGPELNETLASFAADLKWLQEQGAQIRRFNLGHDPGEFATNPVVRGLLKKQGMAGLPVTIIGNEVIAASRYPGRDELWDGLCRSRSSDTDPVGTG